MIVAFVSLALLGLVVGSFLNVVIHRVPAGGSVVRPRSACPTCGHVIGARDNVPVLSWLLLKGRCRACRTRIPARYPAVELATAALFVLTGAHVATTYGTAAVPAFLYLAAIGIALTVIDVQVHRLPNAIVLPSYPVLAALLAVASWGTGDWPALLRAVIGGVVLYVVYFLLAIAKPGGMGFGDVKLAGLLGAGLAWCGWAELAVGSFAAFLLGGVYALALLALGRAGRSSGIPFGPWMILGAAVGVAVGAPIWDAYLGLVL